jgi:hypothetical protein
MSTIFDNIKNKSKCQKFTPETMVETMLNIAGYNTNLAGKRVLENSFGSGNVLAAIVKRYILDSIKLGINVRDISQNLSKDIFGIELDRDLYSQCKARLDKIVDDFGIPKVNWSLYNDNALTWQTNYRFDYIIGNPPYINYKDIDEDSKQFIRETFSSCSNGKFDYCYAFIERSISLLTPTGKLVQLVPANIYKNVFGEKLRNLLRPNIRVINEYPEQKLFDSTLTSSTIFLFDFSYTSPEVEYNNLTDGRSVKVPRTSLRGKWVFQSSSSGSGELIRFGDCFHASIVVATLLNKAFILSKEQRYAGSFEDTVIRKAAAPKVLRRKNEEFIIFPYYYSEKGLQRFSQEEFEQHFPNTAKYLKGYLIELNERDKDTTAQWFEYGRSQALAHLNQPKLLLSTVITNTAEVYHLDSDTIPYSGIFITVKDSKYTLDDAKKILQSQHFLSYVNSLGISISGKSKRITCKDINNYKFVKGKNNGTATIRY